MAFDQRSKLVLFLVLLSACSTKSNVHAATLQSSEEAVAALAVRVLGSQTASFFSFNSSHNIADCDVSIGPCVTVQPGTAYGTIEIHGIEAVEMAYGLSQYCKKYLHMSFTWERSGGFQTALPTQTDLKNQKTSLKYGLPPLTSPMKLQKRCSKGQGNRCHTHYMNVVTSSYSAWNWNWARWEREIDWMAMHGITLVFAFTGQEHVWRETYRELGLNDTEIQTSFDGPAFLAWSRGQSHWENGAVFDANDNFVVSLTDEFLVGQWNLQKQIVARQTELGIGSVLPAFSGNVPGQLKNLFPHANITGVGTPGPVWLDGLDPLFHTISTSFLSKAVRDFGRTGYYEADGFFNVGAAPWLSSFDDVDSASANQQVPGFATIPSTPCSPAITTRSTHEQKQQLQQQPTAALNESPTTCEYGPEIKMHYIAGYVTDKGKIYTSLAAAKTACTADEYCGGVLSRSCNANNTECAAFQTRSGMTPCPFAGVPCPNELPKVLPEPVKAGAQNSYLILNARDCGHHPPLIPPKAPGSGLDAFKRASVVYGAMKAIDPNATWVYQGWPWMREFLGTHTFGMPDEAGAEYMGNFTSAVAKDKLLILDMRCECEAVSSRTKSFYGTPFVWEVMDDFGGTNGMFGDVGLVRDQLAAAVSGVYGDNLTTLAGNGISMEGIDQNPVFYEAVLDGLWYHQNVTTPSTTTVEYIQNWGVQRCGKALPDVIKAWGILANTTFRRGQGVGLGHRYCSNYNPPTNWDAWLIGHGESLLWRGGYETDVEAKAYTDQLFEAWKLLTETADECDTAAARFDVADLGREWLQSVPCNSAFRGLATAWKARNQSSVSKASAALLGSIRDIDVLLSTATGFTFGAWIESARNLSNTTEGKAQLELNARAQVTSWATFPSGGNLNNATMPGISDYAIKQWGGLMREYQGARLKMFTDQVATDLADNATTVNVTQFKQSFLHRQIAWLHNNWNSTELPSTGVGDVVAISRALQQKYSQGGSQKEFQVESIDSNST